MKRRGLVRLAFGVAFVVFLVDGGALIWLGQLTGRNLLVGIGVVLLLVTACIVPAYRRWLRVLDEIEQDRRDVKEAVEALRDAAQQSRTDRWRT